MCENAAESWEGGLDSCDVGVIEGADGFGNEVWPGGGGDDDLGEEAVEVGFDDEAGGEVMVYSDTVARGEGKGGDGSSVKCPVCGGVFCGDAKLDGVEMWRN